ncbi:guanylate cyclase [Xiamenia xianingshaonis]|uniref:guanylate cyclase n=1 Tax=Xiamenia xianingshaonis TaxID=2682776 RepID=UPI0021BD946D|nr:guanylate cyclase [Xiamenia xianingshaonis]
MAVRLVRMIPVLVVLALLAAGVYLYISYRHSPLRAKEVLIKMFLVLTIALSAFFGIVTLYALFEANAGVFDLFFSFMLAALVGLGITLVCRWRFLKHHPAFKDKAFRAKIIPKEPAWLQLLKQIFGMIGKR